jgi:undecaprenyl diphosphate synthase
MSNPQSKNEYLRHIAIIMDGNGRWAQEKQKPRSLGHKKGVETLKELVKACSTRKVEVLTAYAFSSENWQRPKKEVSLLMELFITALRDEVNDLHKNNVKLCFIGDQAAFPEKLQKGIKKSEELTKNNTGLKLFVAANYGGRWDIVNACRKIAFDVEDGKITADQINETVVADNICLGDVAAPDLFIRTGGERRISNYLLWQLAYTELYFTNVLWPDFDENELDIAIDWFNNRQRKFGRTSEQINKASA